MTEDTFPVRLTRAELWAVWQGMEAAFTDPSEMEPEYRTALDKISRAFERARKARGDSQ